MIITRHPLCPLAAGPLGALPPDGDSTTRLRSLFAAIDPLPMAERFVEFVADRVATASGELRSGRLTTAVARGLPAVMATLDSPEHVGRALRVLAASFASAGLRPEHRDAVIGSMMAASIDSAHGAWRLADIAEWAETVDLLVAAVLDATGLQSNLIMAR